MRHFPHLQRIVRAGLNGGDMIRPLGELKLALEADARESGAPEVREAVLWLARQIEAARGGGREDGPTAETTAKARLSADPVEAMYRRGRIGEAELAAIGRMRRCWLALGSGLELRASHPDGAVRDASRRTIRNPADRMPDWLWLEVRHVFTPWAAAQKGRVRLDSRRLEITGYELAWRIIMDSIPLRRLEREHRVRSGRLAAAFVATVSDYLALHEKAGKSGALKVIAEDA
jgi:hypothetical protein